MREHRASLAWSLATICLTAATLYLKPQLAGGMAKASRTMEVQQGRQADVPEAIPGRGLNAILWRVIAEVSDDRVMLIAAGVTFYLLLALFPGLAALVSLYGIFADPTTISEHLATLSSMLPPGAFDIVADQIKMLSGHGSVTLGLTFFGSLAVALWSAHSGVLALFDAMNIAYEEKEKRGFVRLNLVGLAFTLCFMVAAVALVGLVAVLPAVLKFTRLDGIQEQMALLLRWPLLFLVVGCAVLAVYRFGPSRQPARFRWMMWGVGLATVLWFGMSVGFSYYMTHFADYNATYGTLGTLMGFLIWTWLSVAILIVGAELNAELEHQTAKDTTTGRSRPRGARGAYVADKVAGIDD